jgi:L-fucose isomerase-like protein
MVAICSRGATEVTAIRVPPEAGGEITITEGTPGPATIDRTKGEKHEGTVYQVKDGLIEVDERHAVAILASIPGSQVVQSEEELPPAPAASQSKRGSKPESPSHTL